ncbi:hypothetical protein C8Q74DRAFT_149267 [Fomes fomentarius]|nr:hypothetical protein C8Q74DRAFT_149267 [Fomes fomentarius]
MQAVLYWSTYPADPLQRKSMVVAIWILDLIHSGMVCVANWQNVIASFGVWQRVDYIHWSIAVTVALTALTTFIVHCFFSHRIHTLSHRKWYITAPLVTLALVRLISTAEMIRLESFSQFVERFNYVFTLGLSASAGLDVLITVILCYYLRQRRSGLAKMDRIIDTLTLYTVENGMLTCITTTVSLICWVRMPHNLIFLGLHLAISKLYATSFMASLNARKSLTHRSEGTGQGDDYPMPVVFPTVYSPGSHVAPWSPHGRSISPVKPLQVNIDVERTIHREALGQSQEEVNEMTPSESANEEKVV